MDSKATVNVKQAIARLREMQKWRRAEGKYETCGSVMPCDPWQFGEDIDALIAFAENGLALLQMHNERKNLKTKKVKK